VLTHATVTQIRFDGRRATGAVFEQDGQTHQAAARQEVILAAGAFHSPKLLMLSGVGPAAQLQSLGLPVRADLPGVGEGLHEHPELYVEYRVSTPTYATGLGTAAKLISGVQYLFARSGPAASPSSHVNGYLRTRPELAWPDLLLFAEPWGQLASEQAFNGPQEIFSISPALCQPTSRGQVRLRSANPQDDLLIRPNLLGAEQDVRTLMAGVRLVDKIAGLPPFSAYCLERLSPATPLEDDAALEDWIRSTAGICYHASSTCRMGDDPLAVVDPDLRVRGFENLRVCDTSAFPFVPSGNTAAPVIAFAELAAERIRATRAPDRPAETDYFSDAVSAAAVFEKRPVH
jgi:choline dehydrogenase